MSILSAIALASTMALAAPALAQEAGAPGATGTGGSLTGSNTGSGSRWNSYDRGYYDRGGAYYGGEIPGDGVTVYDEGPYDSEPGMVEGRAAAPDHDYADPNPRTVRGDQNGQDLAR